MHGVIVRRVHYRPSHSLLSTYPDFPSLILIIFLKSPMWWVPGTLRLRALFLPCTCVGFINFVTRWRKNWGIMRRCPKGPRGGRFFFLTCLALLFFFFIWWWVGPCFSFFTCPCLSSTIYPYPSPIVSSNFISTQFAIPLLRLWFFDLNKFEGERKEHHISMDHAKGTASLTSVIILLTFCWVFWC